MTRSAKRGIFRSGIWLTAAFITVLLSGPSCNKSRKPVAASQPTFGSPEEAGSALLSAVNAGDRNTLIAIFGPNSGAVLFTGDASTDRARLNDFATAYNQMHRWSKIKAGGQVLCVGAGNQPFPIPLGEDSSGRWYFDTAAGRDEILARRIGKNELTAIDASRALAQAERQYFHEPHDGGGNQYARKLVSDSGKQNGLVWLASDGQASGPLSGLGDFAKTLASAPAGTDPEFNGYRFRILTKGGNSYIVDGRMTGGFAILAYPVEYRNSGITSFLIGEDGVLYQKDLGEQTTGVATSLTAYYPAAGWTPVSPSTGSATRTGP
jgi:hypothetical protein